MSVNRKIAIGGGIIFVIILGIGYWLYVSAPAVIAPSVELPVPVIVPIMPTSIPDFPQGKG